MENRIFYSPVLMPDDRYKIIFGVFAMKGQVAGYEDHASLILSKIIHLVQKAKSNGVNITELCEKNLGMNIKERSEEEIAAMIFQSKAMEECLSDLRILWNAVKESVIRSGNDINEVSEFSKEAIQTASLIESLTLKKFIEQLTKTFQRRRNSPGPARRKIFFNSFLMSTDKLKILLSAETLTGKIESLEEHITALHTKICELILSAWDEGYDVQDLVEFYLGETIEGGGFRDMAWQILEFPQMSLLKIYLSLGWKVIELNKTSSPNLISKAKEKYPHEFDESDEEGELRTVELCEDLTLHLFLEQLSMLPNDLIQ